VEKHREAFWEIYWSRFSSCLLNKQQRIDNFIKILDYWLNAEAHFSGKLPYFIPDFFMRFPAYLKEVKKAKGYNQIKNKFEDSLRQKKWYGIIEPILNDKASLKWLKVPFLN
jgi:hypothetical protein